jgi:hypothetical protein
MEVNPQNITRNFLTRKKIILALFSVVAAFTFYLQAAQAKIIAQIVNNNGLVRQQIFDSDTDLNLFVANNQGTLTATKIRDIPDTASPDDLKNIDQSINDFNAQQQKIFQDANGGSSSIWSWLSFIPDKIFGVLLGIIYIILWLVYSIAYGLVYLAESILKLVIDPQLMKALGGFTTAQFVKSVAQTLANFCNMIYLFILIYIALGTMFGRSNTRQLLTKLVIAALLTNFGLVLAGIVIDFSQVIMYSIFTPDKIQAGFSPGTDILKTVQAKLDIGSTSLSGLWSFVSKFFSWNSTSSALFKDIMNLLFLIFMALALVVTLLTIALLLIIRIIVLWVLLILTPIAFLFSTLPQTEKYWNMWLENLTKYAFTGPILVFFLWFAKKVADNFQGIDQLNQLGKNLPNQDDLKYAFYALFAQNFVSFFQMLVLVVIIWAGILIANRFKIVGAPSLQGMLNRTLAVPGAISGLVSSAMNLSGRAGYVVSGFFKGRREREFEEAGMKEAKARREGDLTEANKQAGIRKQKRAAADWWEKGRTKILKGAAFAPNTVKKEFSTYWKQSSEEFHGNAEASLREFSRRKFLDHDQDVIKKAKIASNTRLLDAEIQLKEKIKARDGSTDSEMTERLNSEIKEIISGIGDIIVDDKDEDRVNKKKDIANSIDGRRMNGSDKLIEPKYFRDAEYLAEKKKKEQLATSLVERDRAEKEVKQAEEKIEKMKLTPEQMVAMFNRGEGDQATQTALLRKIAASGKHFGDLLQKSSKVFYAEELQRAIDGGKSGTEAEEEALRESKKRAMQQIMERTSENELLAGLRAADEEGRKSHNLSLIGHVTFDKISGTWRLADHGETMNAVNKYVYGMTANEYNQLNLQSFEDRFSRKSMASTTDFLALSKSNTFLKNMSKGLQEQIVKYRKEIEKDIEKAYEGNQTKIKEQIDGLEFVINRTNPEWVQNPNRPREEEGI